MTITSPARAPGRPAEPLALLDPSGVPVADPTLAMPDERVLLSLYRDMVVGRRFETQATLATRQGRLGVYPSARGQEACQVGASAALRPGDWLFPTYRDSVAVLTRGVEPLEVAALFEGGWHCGYDPVSHHVAPQCTPLATSTLHAVGLGHAARHQGEDTVALALLGDGATSEGDTHEALNFAAVWNAPVVFLVQNNGWAISVPTERQSAVGLALKGSGHGVRSLVVDGNDAAAVYRTVADAVARAAAGAGPTLVEALTYRVEAHTNADDPSRYRDDAEVTAWLARDPLDRLERHLAGCGLLDDARRAEITARAEAVADALRALRGERGAPGGPAELFAHVYAEPTAALREQQAALTAELAAELGPDPS